MSNKLKKILSVVWLIVIVMSSAYYLIYYLFFDINSIHNGIALMLAFILCTTAIVLFTLLSFFTLIQNEDE